jgi:hypothetical protein
VSTRAARVFLPDLRALEPELPLSIPERVRILAELEYDLEELRARFEGEGLSPEDARARALDALVPDPAVLMDLGRVHMPGYVRLTRSVALDRLQLAERAALAVATAGVLVVQAFALLSADLLSDPSPYLLLVLALGALVFASAVAKAFQVWVKRDHRAPASGISVILGLSLAVLGAGVLGVVLDLYRVAGLAQASPPLADDLLTRWLIRDAALLSVAILIALSGALAWFVLTQWLAFVSEARRSVLGLASGAPTHKRRES